MIPFDEEELAYIAQLDAEADCELLRRELPSLRDECARTLTIATVFLKARPLRMHVAYLMPVSRMK